MRILLSGFFLFYSSTAWAAVSPSEIIGKADEIRNPSKSFVMNVEVKDSDRPDKVSAFEVAISGNTKTLIKTKKPRRDRGRNMLMLEENMWLFIPNLKRPVRVSLSQKLTGQAANGDISRMRWSGDYAAKLEKEDAKTWILFLTARKKGLTYDKLRVWIEKSTFRPQKAEFLSVNGKPLKNATFKGYRQIAGKIRPTEILIEDAVRKNSWSLIQIQSMTVKKLSASMFNKNNLK